MNETSTVDERIRRNKCLGHSNTLTHRIPAAVFIAGNCYSCNAAAQCRSTSETRWRRTAGSASGQGLAGERPVPAAPEHNTAASQCCPLSATNARYSGHRRTVGNFLRAKRRSASRKSSNDIRASVREAVASHSKKIGITCDISQSLLPTRSLASKPWLQNPMACFVGRAFS